MGWKLADLFVEFTAKGIGEIGAAMDAVKDDLQETRNLAREVGKVAEASFGVASTAAQVFGAITVSNFGVVGTAALAAATKVTTITVAATATGIATEKAALAGSAALLSLAAKSTVTGQTVENAGRVGSTAMIALATKTDLATAAIYRTNTATQVLKRSIEQLFGMMAGGGKGGGLSFVFDMGGSDGMKMLTDQRIWANVKVLKDNLLALPGPAKAAGESLKSGFGVMWWALAHFEKKLGDLGENWAKLRSKTAWGLAGVTATLGGFIRSGLHGTAVGEMLDYRMHELSRTIAGLFRPELQQLTQIIGKVVEWFRSLSDSQREQIAFWVKLAIVVGAIAVIAPTVISSINLIRKAVLGLGAAMAFATGFSGGWAKLLAGIAIAGAGIYAAKKISDSLTPDPDDRQPGDRGIMGEPNGHISNIQDTWKRIQESAYDTIPSKQLAEQEKTNQLLGTLVSLTGNMKPAVI